MRSTAVHIKASDDVASLNAGSTSGRFQRAISAAETVAAEDGDVLAARHGVAEKGDDDEAIAEEDDEEDDEDDIEDEGVYSSSASSAAVIAKSSWAIDCFISSSISSILRMSASSSTSPLVDFARFSTTLACSGDTRFVAISSPIWVPRNLPGIMGGKFE